MKDSSNETSGILVVSCVGGGARAIFGDTCDIACVCRATSCGNAFTSAGFVGIVAIVGIRNVFNSITRIDRENGSGVDSDDVSEDGTVSNVICGTAIANEIVNYLIGDMELSTGIVGVAAAAWSGSGGRFGVRMIDGAWRTFVVEAGTTFANHATETAA